MNIDWTKLTPIIESHQDFVISSHIRPDADALGSEVALAMYLDQLGKQAKIINPGQSPQHLQFLDPAHRIQTIVQAGASSVKNAHVHFILDTSSWKQLATVGEAFKESSSIKVVIDHHFSSDDLGAQVELKDTSEPATGCLIFDFLQHVGAAIDPIQAQALYAAIATDTGWYRFPATKSSTYRMAAELMDLGASPQDIYTQLYEQCSPARLMLTGRILQRVHVVQNGHVAYTYVAQKDLAETSSHPADTENFVNECLKIAGVKIAFICVEQQNRTIKTSFRSRVGSNVAKLAETFGGGGHKQASGAVIHANLEEAIQQVLSRISTTNLDEIQPLTEDTV